MTSRIFAGSAQPRAEHRSSSHEPLSEGRNEACDNVVSEPPTTMVPVFLTLDTEIWSDPSAIFTAWENSPVPSLSRGKLQVATTDLRSSSSSDVTGFGHVFRGAFLQS